MTNEENNECFRKGILAIAQDLHMSTTGASPSIPYANRVIYIEYLTNRLASWTPGAPFTALYDEAVRRLVTEALLEARACTPRVVSA